MPGPRRPLARRAAAVRRARGAPGRRGNGALVARTALALLLAACSAPRGEPDPGGARAAANSAQPDEGAAAGARGAEHAGARAGPAAGTAPERPAAARPAPPPDELPWPVDSPPLRKALWVGSWVPDGEHGFAQAWVDEQGLREVWSQQKAGRRTWSGAHGDGDVFPLDVLVRDRQGPAVAYVYSLLSRVGLDDPLASDPFPDAPAVLHVRHQGRLQVRLDGRVVLDEPAPAGGGWAVARAPLTLTGPYDVLLLKAGRGDGHLGASMAFELRVSTPHGLPIPGQGWNTMRPPGLPSDLEPGAPR